MLGGGAGAGVARKPLLASQSLGTGLTFELPLLDIFFFNLTFLVVAPGIAQKLCWFDTWMLLWYLGFACSLDIANAVSAAAFLISPVSQ